ncbi:uncharacterized protein LOC114398364 [Glycine soja]|uniref:uncharacterized protein LOC114398364 n=1 Tax=Glycine soja TaxID=3848 RepID=UPI00103E3117|nr:uncharacterized protein LOC114398364 [Glycine soja]
MDKDQWMYDSIMFEEVDMNDENENEAGLNEEEHVDCSDVLNTSQWARSVAYEIGFVAMIMKSDTNTDIRGRTSFVLIGCERSGQYRSRKKDFVRRDTSSRKCGCPFKLRGKPVVGAQGWMIAAEYECVHYAGKNPSRCGCVMRTTHGLLYACELSKYVIVKRSASSSDQAIPRRTMPMLDRFHPFIHDLIENIVDVKADGNCGYLAIVVLLGMGNGHWCATIFLKNLPNGLMSISTFLVVTMDKWMDITDMGYVIASRFI